ncbi:MAG: bifunctional acetate--CoA ligase family protein/GNAT family N-acetyltransferase [Proteobacteria bacterium]|nr:bifunctional acetate--CoA ligase family protein/GNAT family N-acetyltransferase [Pseudomonadota bacterium]
MRHPSQPLTTRDPAHDYLGHGRRPLDAFFTPQSVAVIGASETPGSVGRTVLKNLIASPFGGTVYPVNIGRSSVLGIRAYPTVADVPEPIDLAVVITPARVVPDVIRQCAAAGIKNAVIISAGFKELGAPGVALEQEILQHARLAKMRVIGPNCLGVMSPRTGLNATFAAGMGQPGNVAFISQSGALCTAILDWSFRERVGFSAFVSIGSMLDVSWGDLIDHLGSDPHTKSIVIYMESIGDARAFLSAAREVALSKPIVVIKAGQSEQAAKAAASHTGTLAGSDAVLDAAFRRVGVLRIHRIADLFNMAEVLAKQPTPKGPRLTVLTNAGGPGVLATDALIAVGGQLAELAPQTIAAFDQLLPPHWSHGNPVDILGDADAERYAKALEIAARDPNSDGLLVVLTPQDMTDPTQTAERLVPYARATGKPVLASWMGGTSVDAGTDILNRSDIATFRYADDAARAFCYMARYAQALRAIYETPGTSGVATTNAPDIKAATQIIEETRAAGRTLLTEIESKRLLAAYGIPTTPAAVASTAQEAVVAAKAFGYPVVLKIHSLTITHKTDVGGVRLNLQDERAVEEAFATIERTVGERLGASHFQGVVVQPMVRHEGYELILGSSQDPQFGPVLLFGAGGQLVEVFKDSALGLPPLTATLARRMMERTKIVEALRGVRGRAPVDLPALEALIVRFSQLVVEQRWIKECDINPLLASPQGLIALDARVVLHGPELTEEELPRAAIRPYPQQYVMPWSLPDGASVTIRPIRPDDEPLMVRFHETLSADTVRQRYLHDMHLSHRVAHERLQRVCFNDYDRELALVAEQGAAQGRSILAVGRLSKLPGRDEAEFAIVVADPTQRRGLGTKLLQELVRFGRDEHLQRIGADIQPDNLGMQRIAERAGFTVRQVPERQVVRATIEL